MNYLFDLFYNHFEKNHFVFHFFEHLNDDENSDPHLECQSLIPELIFLVPYLCLILSIVF